MNSSATPLTKEQMKLARAKSSPSSVPGPDGVPYSVWKKVNLVNPAIILELLSPLVTFGYQPHVSKKREWYSPRQTR